MPEKDKPQIEAEINERLEGDLKENALAFAAYLNENQMAPQQWFGPGFWRVPWEDSFLCGTVVQENRWRFWFFRGDYSGTFNEAFIATVHDHVRPCINCTTDCKFGEDNTVFGKAFENTCYQFPVQFENPDKDTLEHIKELIEYWKKEAPNSDGWHVH